MIIVQQTQTLLHILQTKQTPNFPIFLFNQLQKIDFDFSKKSIQNLTVFLNELQKKGFNSQKILAQTGGNHFLLAIAVYIGEYLAKNTGFKIIWCDYHTAAQEIYQQNQQYNTDYTLQNSFANSLLAKIGEVHCQPLAIIDDILENKNTLVNYIEQIQDEIFAKNQIHLFDEPNLVAKKYLEKVKTGQLLDKNITFFDELRLLNFDFSKNSLVEIDKILEEIKQKYHLQPYQYAEFIQKADFQYFCYLLGFYIGATASRLANIAIKWVSFDEMQAMFGDSFENCLEHRFVLIMENHYRTPMLIISNHLFGVAPHFPKSAVEFANILWEQNASILNIFPLKPSSADNLAKSWQQMINPAVKLLHDAFLSVIKQKIFNPTLFYLQKNLQTSRFEPVLLAIDNLNIEQAIDNLYEDFDLYQKTSPIVLGCYPMFANLPTGREKAITLELRCHQPMLALQVIVPYQDLPDFAILPAVNNQENLSEQQIALINAILWQFGLQKNDKRYWKDDWCNDFVKTEPVLPITDDISAINIELLPFAEKISATGLNVALPKFDYSKVRWQGFDLPKFVLEMTGFSQSYLQVFAPSRLLNDELFSQINALGELYRYGKVVWGAVVKADSELSEPFNEPKSDKILRADIVYDPAGGLSVDSLLEIANRLQKLQQADIATLSENQTFLAMHLQDDRSAVFNYKLKENLMLSTTWVWQRHLPAGILSDRLVPLIINPKNESVHAGRVMILPSRFWQQRQDDGQDLYQYWLGLSLNKFNKNLDLMPSILADEQQGNWYDKPPFVGLQSQIFPKFKINSSQSANVAKAITTNTMPQSGVAVSPISEMPMPTRPMAMPNINNPQPIMPVATDNVAKPAEKTVLTAELQRQLLADQARLTSQLSTKDDEKQRKLYIIIAVVVVLLGLAMLMALMMKK